MTIDDLIERLAQAMRTMGIEFEAGERELRAIAELVEHEEAKARILRLADAHHDAALAVKEMDRP